MSKRAFFTNLTTVVIAIAGFVAMYAIFLWRDSQCVKNYGVGWKSRGYQTVYCANQAGDVKAFQ